MVHTTPTLDSDDYTDGGTYNYMIPTGGSHLDAGSNMCLFTEYGEGGFEYSLPAEFTMIVYFQQTY